ncbi:DHA2 family efflux MFS transporter permease subunit [Tessaracoccus sp. OS52]|uniref:MDR family MFS transporter n=1 Tax=Tessaracoccus sp. OS52 TaxID=2886691 RepID=UPI001D0F90B3|nr:MDR family MFS transporter [Tessaracoccus sp. OS52]MCC2592057.1 DHA2 family efflux MFS transporter permease subunit [Tessaracoccus sp. OS52]
MMLKNDENNAPADDRLPPGSRSVIAILLASAFVVILNETTLTVALKWIMDDLGVTERAAQWLTTAFMLTMAVIIPVTGWLLERFPTRQVFILAMALFSAGTLLVIVSPTFPLVLAGRVVQASGTAVMMPLLMTTIMNVVPQSRRGAMMGNISMVISVAPALGPTVSGLVLQFANWRVIFMIVLPLAVLLGVFGALRIRSLNEPRDVPVDAVSIGLAIVGFGGLVYALSLIGVEGGSVAQLAGVLVLGLASLVAFLWRQVILGRSGRALLNLDTFRHPGFRIALTVVAIAMAALFGTLIMLPLILQNALGMQPLTVGLVLLPGGLVMGILGPTVGKLYDRVGPRPLVIPACLLIGAVLFGLSTISVSTSPWFIVACHVAMSVGFAFMFTPLLTTALGSLPPALYPHGSATMGTVQQLAGAIGTAVFVTIYATQTRIAAGKGIEERVAMLTGSRLAFLAAAGVWALGFIGSWWLRRPSAEAHTTVEPVGDRVSN